MTCFVYYVYEGNSKMFFLADVLFLRGHLALRWIQYTWTADSCTKPATGYSKATWWPSL